MQKVTGVKQKQQSSITLMYHYNSIKLQSNMPLT